MATVCSFSSLELLSRVKALAALHPRVINHLSVDARTEREYCSTWRDQQFQSSRTRRWRWRSLFLSGLEITVSPLCLNRVLYSYNEVGG